MTIDFPENLGDRAKFSLSQSKHSDKKIGLQSKFVVV